MTWVEPWGPEDESPPPAALAGPPWHDVFGDEYDIPVEILYLVEEGFLFDRSGAFPVPAFGVSFSSGAEIVVFVDHPKPSERPGKRFTVMLRTAPSMPMRIHLETSRVEDVVRTVSKIYRRYNIFRLLD